MARTTTARRADVEGNENNSNSNNSNNSRGVPSNPYNDNNDNNNTAMTTAAADKLVRLLYMAVTIYVLHRFFNFFRVLFQSPHIRHGWFQLGLAGTIAVLGVKAYVEIWQGRVQHATVNYQNFRQSTHAAMFLIGLSSVAFNVALWPHYGWNAPFVLGLTFWGIVLQFCLLLPIAVQNIIAAALLTLFVQEYAGYSNYLVY